jgi:hypothetical protein
MLLTRHQKNSGQNRDVKITEIVRKYVAFDIFGDYGNKSKFFAGGN